VKIKKVQGALCSYIYRDKQKDSIAFLKVQCFNAGLIRQHIISHRVYTK